MNPQGLVTGVSLGAAYAIGAVGITLVFHVSRVLNLSHGAVMMGVGLFLAHRGYSSPWALIAVGIPLGAALAAIVHLLIIHPFRARDHVTRLAVLVGVLFAAGGLAQRWAGTDSAIFSPLIHGNWQIPGGATLGKHALLTLIAVFAVAIVVSAFLNGTTMGKSMKAISEDSRRRGTHRHLGQPPPPGHCSHLRRTGRPGGCTHRPADRHELQRRLRPHSGISGVGSHRRSPISVGCCGRGPLDRHRSGPPVAVLPAVVQHAPVRPPHLGACFPATGLVGGGKVTPLQRYVLPKSAAGLAIMAAAVYLLPKTVGTDWRAIGAFAAFYAIAVVGLDITWGVAGQTSLGQQGFIAIGAYAVGTATTKWDWPAPLSIVFSVVFGCAIAYGIGRVVLRLSEVYLALATLAFGLMVPVLATSLDSMGKSTGLFGIPRLEFPLIDIDRRQWYWAGWVIAGLAVIIAIRFARSMTGLGWRFVAGNQQAAEALGVPLRFERRKAFMVSGGFAAVAGSLYAMLNTAIGPDAFGSRVLLIMMFSSVVGGRGTIIGPAIGVMLTEIAIIYSGRTGGSADLILGIAFILALYFLPRGIAGFAQALLKRVASRSASDSIGSVDSAPASPAHDRAFAGLSPEALQEKFASWRSTRPHKYDEWGSDPHTKPTDRTVEIRHVSKHFGGLHALTDVTITFEPGVVHGIVGPNGAGKSTLLAVASGAYTADAGNVVCFGDVVTGWPAWKRARHGMARTFQAPQLVGNLSVLENVAGGVYPILGAGLGRSLTPLEGRALSRARDFAEEALETLGIAHLGNAMPFDLSFGQQRLIELGRALVRAPSILWLDEPASGLDQQEKELLSTIVTSYARTGAVVGFIEHDTELVAKTCAVATVLDAGRVVHHGPASTVFDVDLVRELYMGADDETLLDPTSDLRAEPRVEPVSEGALE